MTVHLHEGDVVELRVTSCSRCHPTTSPKMCAVIVADDPYNSVTLCSSCLQELATKVEAQRVRNLLLISLERAKEKGGTSDE